MTTTELPVVTGERAYRTGLYLSVLQLVFTLLWTTYVIYLPKLAAQVGIAPAAVILILMMDQAIFTITDTAMGIAADKMEAMFGRLGVFVGALTLLSCAAFAALPFVADMGPAARGGLIALIAIWAVTSSALRAPPLVLLSKYRAKPRLPFLAALVMLGYGIAGAVSRYLGTALSDYDPRMPFILSSAVLLLVALGLTRVERDVAKPAPAKKVSSPTRPLGMVPVVFIAAMAILALGFELHASINNELLYLRFAKPGDLEWLVPVFWIGFSIAMFPASVVVKHRGGLMVMGLAGLFGAVAIVAAETAGGLDTVIVAQLLAGAAWGCVRMSAIPAALAIGAVGAEGKVTGLMFSALALATFARIAMVASGLQRLPDYAPLLHWAPVACWSVAGCGLLVLAASRVQGARRV
jgi:MFS family permease